MRPGSTSWLPPTRFQPQGTQTKRNSDMQVWIMEAGEIGEGGRIVGVYAEKDLAHGDFKREAMDLNDRFTGEPLDAVEHGEDGSLYLHAGCDYLSLVPHAVVTTASAPAGSGSAALNPATQPELEASS